MPSCSFVIRTLTKSTVTIMIDIGERVDDQLMQIDQRTEFFQFDQLHGEEAVVDRAWTGEVSQLETLVQSYPNKHWSWEEIASVFKTLVLSGCNITYVDKDVTLLSNVTRFDVSSNKLTHIDDLPPRIVGLFMNCNPLWSTAFRNIHAPFLRYLDLSYCELPEIPVLSSSFPALCALDFSGNDILDLTSLTRLEKLPLLSHLCLMLNPVVLIPCYRETVLSLLPNLTQLDEIQKSINILDVSPAHVTNIIIRVSFTSLRGLTEQVTSEDSYFGQLEVSIAGVVACSCLLPWGRSLIIEEGDTPDPTPVSEETKVDKKKKGKPTEELVPPVPIVDRAVPQVLDLSLPLCARTRDGILLEGVEIVLKRLKRANDETIETINIAASEISVKRFLDVSGNNRHVKEVTRMMPRSEESEPPAIHVTAELNPEE